MDFASLWILGQYEVPAQQSYLMWMYRALGPFYAVVIPLAGLAVFVGACAVVAVSRRPAVIAAYLVFLPLPFLIGLFASIQGFINIYLLIAHVEIAPRPAELAGGISAGLVSMLVGLGVTFPSYFVLAVGLFLRTALSGKTEPR